MSISNRANFVGGVLLARDVYERSEVTFGNLVVESEWCTDSTIKITRNDALVATFSGDRAWEQAFAWIIEYATDEEIKRMTP